MHVEFFVEVHGKPLGFSDVSRLSRDDLVPSRVRDADSRLPFRILETGSHVEDDAPVAANVYAFLSVCHHIRPDLPKKPD